MLSIWKDIAVLLQPTPEGERLGDRAATIAQAHKSHLVGVYGVVPHSHEHSSHEFAIGSEAIAEVITRQRQADEQTALAVARHFGELSRRYGITSEFRIVWSGGVGSDWTMRGLHCDLIVVAHPKPERFADAWSAERLVLESGVPVLAIPSEWHGESIGRNVIVAWNGSREARRAIADSMPVLSTADRVTVLVIDPERTPERFGAQPGADLVKSLIKHDVRAELAVVQSNGTPVGSVIQAEVQALQADLLVIGAYSRPRAAEVLFGGTTRTLLADTSIPFLMSR